MKALFGTCRFLCLIFLFLHFSSSPAVSRENQDKCGTCDGKGYVIRDCTFCGGSGVKGYTTSPLGHRMALGCHQCGGRTENEGTSLHRCFPGSGRFRRSCGTCRGTGDSAEVVAERERRAREAARLRRERLEAERREAERKRLAELAEKNRRLRRELKTAGGTGGGELQLKSGTTDKLEPRDTIFGNDLRRSPEGFSIQRTLLVTRGEIIVTDSAFEQLRCAHWLMLRAAEPGRSDEDVKYLAAQAEKAMVGGRLDVVVPPPEETPEVSARMNQYRELSFELAVDRSRVSHLVRIRRESVSVLRELKSKKAALAVPPDDPDEEPVEVPESPKAEKKKSDLLKEMEALAESIEKTNRKIGNFDAGLRVAREKAAESGKALEAFLEKHPDIPVREPSPGAEGGENP